MNPFQAIFLGIVQGLTEFIPVSSQGHLELIPRVLGWTSPSTLFIVFIHIGTLLALIAYFRKDIWRYLKVLWNWSRRHADSKQQKQDLRKILYVVIATIPAGLIGFGLERVLVDFYDNPDQEFTVLLLTLAAMIVVGVFFLFSHRIFTGKKVELSELGKVKAFLVGLSQALAFIRGTSRSGITLLTGQALGLNKTSAAEFSFLMSIPIITATSVWGGYKLLQLPTEELQAELTPAILGAVSAFVFGYIAVKFMLQYLKHNSLVAFGVYRIAFAVIVFLLLVR